MTQLQNENAAEPVADRATPFVIEGAAADLTHFSTAEELARIDRIEAGCIIVRQSLAAAAARIPAEVGAIIAVPDDVEVRIHAGMVTLNGESFAPADGPQTALIVIGSLIVTGAVPKVTYRQISVVGMALIPDGAESVLGAHLKDLVGAAHGYRAAEGQRVHNHAGQVSLSAAMISNTSGTADDVLLVSGTAVTSRTI